MVDFSTNKQNSPENLYLTLIGLILLASIIVFEGLIFRWEPIDDAYISFRYARNLAAGQGLVFNLGERVEGYSNFLWTVILAGTGRLSLDIPWVGKWLGVIFASISICLTWLLARLVAQERGWPIKLAWAAPAILVCYPGWSYWAFSGMEGPLLVCLVIGFLFVGCKPSSSFGTIVLAGVLGILAAMTRWEIVLLWPVVVATQLFDKSKPTSRKLIHSIILSAILLAGFGIYFIFRFLYYGEIMPNTYYAKVGGSLLSRIFRGTAYTGELVANWLLPVTSVVWVLGARQRWTIVLSASLVIYTGYVVWTGGDHYPWLRFYLPMLPIVAIIATETIYRLAALLRQPSAGATNSIYFILTVMLIITLSTIALRFDIGAARGHLRWVRGWKKIGIWAKEAFPPDYQIALAPIGAVGYFSEHPIIDILGLTDYQVAHFGETYLSEPPGHQRSCIEYILRRRPEIILEPAIVFDHPPSKKEAVDRSIGKPLKKMLKLPQFHQLYKYKIAEVDHSYIPYWIYRGVE